MKKMNKETKLRGIIALVFTFFSIALTLVFFVLCLKDGESLLGTLVAAPMLGFIFGGMIVGFCHASVIHQKIKGLLLIPIAGWAIYLVLIIGIPYLGGWIFMLADLFRYLKAKKEVQS